VFLVTEDGNDLLILQRDFFFGRRLPSARDALLEVARQNVFPQRGVRHRLVAQRDLVRQRDEDRNTVLDPIAQVDPIPASGLHAARRGGFTENLLGAKDIGALDFQSQNLFAADER
jgi:hypothetical protein